LHQEVLAIDELMIVGPMGCKLESNSRPDGVYLTETDPPYFREVPAPTAAELQALVTNH
jgi:hypothetical protein